MLSIALAALILWGVKGQQNRLIAALFLPSLAFYGLAYELREYEFVQNYAANEDVYDFDLYLFFGFLLVLSALAALWILPRYARIGCVDAKLEPPRNVNFSLLRTTYFALAGLSLAGFVVNFARVDFSVALLFVAPRVYEEVFGESTALNYLYFLNVPALCLYVYCKAYDVAPRWSTLLNPILVLISVFHGVKFTVFDTVMIPLILYFHISPNRSRAMRIAGLAAVALIGFYIAFSVFVRGASESEGPLVAILNYILPNYYNLAFEIWKTPIQFDPFTLILPDKIPNPFADLATVGEAGFILNEKFNMTTAFSAYYAAFPLVGGLSILPIISVCRHYVWRRCVTGSSMFALMMVTYIDFCLLFSFYFYAFTKTKYIYYLAVMFIIWRLARRNSGNRYVNAIQI